MDTVEFTQVAQESQREYHEYANMFPLMQGEDFEALKEDIARNGLLEPIWLHPDGRIIDGRNRHRVCIEIGVEPQFRIWNGEGSLVTFIVSLNLHRRHLTSSQRATVAVEILPMLETEAKERQRLSEGRGQKGTQIIADVKGEARQQAAEMAHTNRQYVSDAKKLKNDAPELFELVRAGEITIPQAKRELQREEREQTTANILANLPEGKYQCIVIDPPWPVQKILREERPNQNLLDYSTMTIEEISRLPIVELAHEEGCHVYLWVTHKFLPAGLELFKQWGVKYQCVMTWEKPTGMTPFSWMYNTEHVLFGRIGTLKLLKMGLKLSFQAPVTGHSEKPTIFYERVIEASPDPRLEMFARQPRNGFIVWGDEV